MEDQDQKVERNDEPEVEGHKLDKVEGRAELAETEEPDVEAHKFDKMDRHEKMDRADA